MYVIFIIIFLFSRDNCRCHIELELLMKLTYVTPPPPWITLYIRNSACGTVSTYCHIIWNKTDLNKHKHDRMKRRLLVYVETLYYLIMEGNSHLHFMLYRFNTIRRTPCTIHYVSYRTWIINEQVPHIQFRCLVPICSNITILITWF